MIHMKQVTGEGFQVNTEVVYLRVKTQLDQKERRTYHIHNSGEPVLTDGCL